MTRFEKTIAFRVIKSVLPLDTDKTVDKSAILVHLKQIEFAMPFKIFMVLRLGFLLFYLCPLFFIGKPFSLHRLKPAHKEAYLARWMDHPWYLFRQIAILMKLVASTAILGNREVQIEAGFRKRSDFSKPTDHIQNPTIKSGDSPSNPTGKTSSNE